MKHYDWDKVMSKSIILIIIVLVITIKFVKRDMVVSSEVLGGWWTGLAERRLKCLTKHVFNSFITKFS